MNWVGSRLPASANVGYAGGARLADGFAAGVRFGPSREARGRIIRSLCLAWEGAR